MKPIKLDDIQEGLELFLDERSDNTLFDCEDAQQFGEARYQMVEGCRYDYELSDSSLSLVGEVVVPHKRKKNEGSIEPNIYVGTLTLKVCRESECLGTIQLEVRSIKSSYREDYRHMLEYITDRCVDLVLQADSPVSQLFDVDFDKDSETLYQRFCFVRSVVGSSEFEESIQRILTAPVTQWKEREEKKDIRKIRRFRSHNVKQMVSANCRENLPLNHPLRSYGVESVAREVSSSRKEDSVDTPENRFVKHALCSFQFFMMEIQRAAKNHKTLEKEAKALEEKLNGYLQYGLFKEVSNPQTLKLNSPVLQRKEGYREILRAWLMFDLASKLVWKGGDDVYSAGKRDVATLYEYWVFFKLLELFGDFFDIDHDDLDSLIVSSSDDLSLQLKQGKHTALSGVYDSGSRQLLVRFNYNRSFGKNNNYHEAGSWSRGLRPDYTLSLWPYGVNESEAEKEELIVHIHFDAKYKLANFRALLEDSDDGEVKRSHKKEDILKMHAYKDAIRRTGGAYVLYPGDVSTHLTGFHEVLPGLGAFPLCPSKGSDGTKDLREFIDEVINHFLDRASQRERMAYHSYDVYRQKPNGEDRVEEALVETTDSYRDHLPNNTHVLVGYCRKGQLDWIENRLLYNARTGTQRGALKIDPKVAGAKYLLLHSEGETLAHRLYHIVETGPRVFSKATMIANGYSKPNHDYYLVYKLKPLEDHVNTFQWDIRALNGYEKGRGSALPFAVSMAELMKVKV
ncbi:DUF2357 domain-containing protein [Halosquirtibacter xylanolyticus]|uniref:DUF2357 domain-containing protein n=1 Tax=Halosquirtibacter xylanolyticus TaxID=3374599 RepID=UPI00374A351E|nr:DUF2357 domain-containing protein [Prolixibacteraceae bacterium]